MANQKGLIKDTTLFLDGQYYAHTRFENCQMVYGGGVLPAFVENEYIGCSWLLDGPAFNTMEFMKILIAMGGENLVKVGLGIHDGQ